MKKALLAISVLLLLAGKVNAETIHVNWDGSGDYTTIQAAIDAASNGDLILVAEGTYAESITIDKQLAIIGCGFDPVGNLPGHFTKIQGNVNFNAGSDNSIIESFWIYGNVNIASNLSGIAIKRNYCDKPVDETYMIYSLASSIYIEMNILTREGSQINILSGYYVIKNNMFYDKGGTTGCLIYCRGSSFGDVNHNVFLNSNCASPNGIFYGMSNGYICNNIFYACSSQYGGSSGTWAFNASEQSSLPGTDNVILSGSPFVNYDGSFDLQTTDLHLTTGSPCIDAGDPNSTNDRDGTRADMGIYGGFKPFVDMGIPPVPIVLELELPTTAAQGGTMEIHSKGRVGPNW